MHALAHRQHELGGRPIHRITGGDLLAPGLQEVVLGRFGVVGRVAQHREDGADRDVHVDVGRAVERIEQQQEATLGIVERDLVHRLDLFRGHSGKVAAPLVGLQQDLVGDDVELLLRLALHVVGAGLAEHAGERALGNVDADRLHRARDDFDQQAQLGVDAPGALLLDQELG